MSDAVGDGSMKEEMEALAGEELEEAVEMLVLLLPGPLSPTPPTPPPVINNCLIPLRRKASTQFSNRDTRQLQQSEGRKSGGRIHSNADPKTGVMGFESSLLLGEKGEAG